MQHRTEDDTNTLNVTKTRTLVICFVALAVTLAGGLFVGVGFGINPVDRHEAFPVSAPSTQRTLSATPTTTQAPEPIPAPPTFEYIEDVVPVTEPSHTHRPSRPAATSHSTSPSQTSEMPVETTEYVTEVSVPPAVVEVPIVEAPTCELPLEWDGERCYQPQLPEEVIGRQVEGPNGEICTVIDVDFNVECVLPE